MSRSTTTTTTTRRTAVLHMSNPAKRKSTLRTMSTVEFEPIIDFAGAKAAAQLDDNLKGTSNNSHCLLDATKLPANDSGLFPFRFTGVHAGAVNARQ